MSSEAAGGVDKRQLEIEVNSTLGDLPELSTISTSITDDATEFRTQHPYILALVLMLLGLAVGGCVAYRQLRKFPLGLHFNLSECKYVYLDVGSNIGVQIRKLYEPDRYPNSPVVPFFAQVFEGVERKDICALGFEANPKHRKRLEKVSSCYEDSGHSIHIFVPRAVSTETGKTIRIASDHTAKSGEGNSDWCAGEFSNCLDGQGSKVDWADVPTID